MPKVTFYFDCVSPWAYFSYNILKRYEKPWNLDLTIVPIYLGGVMVAAGNKPPVTVLNKGKWMNEYDLPLISKYYQLPVTFPEEFPVQTMSVARLLRVVQERRPEKLREVVDVFFAQIWGPNSEGATRASKPENFRKIIPTSLFSDAELKELMDAAVTPENKERIKTDAATLVEKEGAFGFPWIVVENDAGEKRPFFGADRFEVMGYFLGKKWNGPFPEQSAKL